jgi:transcriptional regulator with XRE-family HTH domain
MENLGQKIRVLRKQRNVSQCELEGSMNASQGSISRIETGLVNPTKETLKKISIALSLTESEFASLFELRTPEVHESNSITTYSSIFQQDLYADQWLRGNIKELYAFMREDTLRLTDRMLLGYAQVALELGNSLESSETIESVIKRNKCIPIELKHYAQLLQAELDMLNKDIETAEEKIMETLAYASRTRNAYLLGKSYFLLGLVCSQKKDIPLGILNLERALECFDIIRFPLEIGKVYLFMTDFLEYQENFEKADEYYARAEEIFASVQNSYLLGWCKGGKAFSNYIRGNLVEALELSKSATKIDRKVGSVKQLCYSTGVLAKTLLATGQFSRSLKTFDSAVSMEKSFRSKPYPSSNYLYTLFIKSQHNHDFLKMLEHDIQSSRAQNDLRKYMLYTAKFANGRSKSEKKEGERGLIEMSFSADYPQLRRVTEATLLTGQLQPIAT